METDLSTALNLAAEVDYNLVEVGPDADPPVVKMMNYSKYKYEEQQKQRERRSQRNAELKEVRITLRTDEGDLERKLADAREILEGGDKLKVTLRMKGRENDNGRATAVAEALQQFADRLADCGTLDGKIDRAVRRAASITMSPKAKKERTQSEQKRRGKDTRAERQARQKARLEAKQEADARRKAEAAEEMHRLGLDAFEPTRRSPEERERDNRRDQWGDRRGRDGYGRGDGDRRGYDRGGRSQDRRDWGRRDGNRGGDGRNRGDGGRPGPRPYGDRH